MCGNRVSDDATMQAAAETNYHGKLRSMKNLDSKPFVGRRFAIIKETVGQCPMILSLILDSRVKDNIIMQGQVSMKASQSVSLRHQKRWNSSGYVIMSSPTHTISHFLLRSLKLVLSFGKQATVDVISCPTFDLGLPAYYILALSEASR